MPARSGSAAAHSLTNIISTPTPSTMTKQPPPSVTHDTANLRKSSGKSDHVGGKENKQQKTHWKNKKNHRRGGRSHGNLQTDKTADPRNSQRLTNTAQKRGKGRNTESFDPESTLVRPAIRIQVGNPMANAYNKPLKHDDVVMVPNLFGDDDDFSLYHDLCEEITELQERGVKGSEWIAWHEGAHLISKQPSGSPTFQKILDRLCEYFQIKRESAGTRFNWYKDQKDWKPFHHDSAAFNPQRAKTQNITVGVSFGACRELAFLSAKDPSMRLYFPQPNNGVFSFGRDVNIQWKHGINALSAEEQEAPTNVPQGRISIILWGLAENCIEEEGSPPLLGADGAGPHAQRNKKHRRRKTSP